MLAHEITHHMVSEISNATPYSMKRKETCDVPMWLEEGLCQLIQSELCPALQDEYGEAITRTSTWYTLEDLWDDLSSCDDVNKAYLQAYKETKLLVETKGKTEIVQLLHLNRAKQISWNDLQKQESKKKERQVF